MLTIFTTPKAFEGHIGIIQRNAIISWTKLKEHPEIILLGNESGTAEICKEFNLKSIPDVELNKYGTPLCRDLFKKAQENSKYSYMALVNADIILTDSFIDSSIHCTKLKKFLMIGQRYDLDVTKPIDFENNNWEEILRHKVKRNGVLHKATGIDYFIFRKFEWMDLPPFAIGRPGWDNWFVSQAITEDHVVIDATASIFVVHQNHKYAKNVKEWKDGIEGWAWQNSENLENIKLVKQNGGRKYTGFTSSAPWIMNRKRKIKCR